MAISEMKAVVAYVFPPVTLLEVLQGHLRAMIANFEFSPSHEGQTAKPTAGVTMSTLANFITLSSLMITGF